MFMWMKPVCSMQEESRQLISHGAEAKYPDSHILQPEPCAVIQIQKTDTTTLLSPSQFVTGLTNTNKSQAFLVAEKKRRSDVRLPMRKDMEGSGGEVVSRRKSVVRREK